MKLLHHNVNDLLLKIEMIRKSFDSLNNNNHVLGITHTKLNSAILDNEVQIDGFVGIRCDYISCAGGGAITFIREDPNLQRRTDLKTQVR